MTRRGLVSKGMGGPQSGGGAALMPKGEKPKGPELLPVAEVARRLRVESGQVETWMQKGQLRGNDSGIRPYDFKKFQLDFAEEIRRAQKQAVAEKQTKSDRKPKKGFLSKFASIFGGGSKGEGGDNKKLAQENKQLKKELQKLRKAKPSGKSDQGDKDLEEKIRFLEKQASESRALEVEVAKLKRQLKEQPGGGAGGGEPGGGNPEAEEQLRKELKKAREQLQDAQKAAFEGQSLRETLSRVEQEKEQLQSTITELRTSGGGSSDNATEPNPETQELQMALAQRNQAFAQLQARAQEMAQENARLKKNQGQVVAAPVPVPVQDSSPLADELLDLQRLNLGRFQRLQSLYQESLERLSNAQQTSAPNAAEAPEFKELEQKYKQLLAQQSTENPAHQEMMDQLSNSRMTVSKLKDENGRLRNELAEGGGKESLVKIKELETKLKEAEAQSGSSKLMENELDTLRKGLQVKENQVQKVASRLADNEKRLAKAMQESARLTELLIERENRLRDLSTEFEQEYRDKMENLDRQVSGLQWKLSLREERIAHLESELLSKGE